MKKIKLHQSEIEILFKTPIQLPLFKKVWDWFDQNPNEKMEEDTYTQVFEILGYSNIRTSFFSDRVKIFGLFKTDEPDFLEVFVIEISKAQTPNGENGYDVQELKKGVLPLRGIPDLKFEERVVDKILLQTIGVPVLG